MKILVYLLFTSLLFSQDSNENGYEFDYFVQYKELRYGETFFILLNTKNPNYLFFGKNYDNNFSGVIYDENSDSFHNFNCTNQNKEIQFEFIESSKKIEKKYINPYVFQKSISKNDSLSTELTILAYDKEIRKKYSRKIDLTLDNSNIKMPYSMLSFFTHGSIPGSGIEIPNGIFSSLTIDYRKGSELKYKLITQKTINLRLIIPQ